MVHFKYSEELYSDLLTRVQHETPLKNLTQAEAGIIRGMFDHYKEGKTTMIGNAFKGELKRMVGEKQIHKDTYKYTGGLVPIGKLEEIFNSMPRTEK